jgi:hypothetical protein
LRGSAKAERNAALGDIKSPVWRCADARTSTNSYSFVTGRNYAVRGR